MVDRRGRRSVCSSLAPTRAVVAPLSKRALVGLLLLGGVLASIVFHAIADRTDSRFHPWRDLELVATYETFIDTGIPLAKLPGTGSPVTQMDTGTGLIPAAWDDDPGIYLAASYVGRAISAPDPYTALRYVQAAMGALPWLILPLLIARLFGRALVGWTLIGLIPLVSLVNASTSFLGTDYGRTGRYITLPVYALYGTAGSVVFLGLAIILLVTTLRLTAPAYWSVVVVVGLMAGLAHLMRAGSGLPVLMAGVVVLATFKFPRAIRITAALLAISIAATTPALVLSTINRSRAAAVGMRTDELPKAHGTWHPLYLGLGYLGYGDAGYKYDNPFGIVWSDEFGWDKAREIDPDVIIASGEYDQIMKDLYFSAVRDHPATTVRTYLAKFGDLTIQQGPMLVVIGGVSLLGIRLRRWRRALLAGFVVALPAVLYGALPPVLVFPMRYYFVENTAGLALLFTVSFGWLTALVLSSRMSEHTADLPKGIVGGPATFGCAVTAPRYSFVLPVHDHALGIEHTLRSLAERLEAGRDEILVIENGSTDGSWNEIQGIASEWPRDAVALTIAKSEPALGTAYRVGSLLAVGRTVVLTADDLPFGFSDLEQFSQISDPGPIAIGSKAHPASMVSRSIVRRGLTTSFYWLRRLILGSRTGDSQGTFFVDRDLLQAFARTSRETGYLWTTELVVACEAIGLSPLEMPVTLRGDHGAHESRVSLLDSVRASVGLLRLGLRRHAYQHEPWLRRKHVLDSSAE